MRITLGKKLFFFTSCLLVAVLLSTFLVLARNQARLWEDYLRSQSLAFARLATPELLKTFRGVFPPQNQANLRQVLDFLGLNRDLIRFSLLAPTGRSLFDSPDLPGFDDFPPLDTEEHSLSRRLQQGEPTVQTLTLSDGRRVLDVLSPAFGPTGEHILSVRYLVSYASVDARLGEVRNDFLRIALLSICGSLLLAALVARRVTRPLSELTEGARAVARGELETRINNLRGDEIGTLAGAFNEMAASLLEGRTQLTEKNRALSAANSELRQMQENLVRTERLAAIGQLAAGVSHEIDNPVGIILGYAELLLEEMAEGDSRRADVQAIIEECRRCRRITGGLLGFARTSPGRWEPVALNAMISQTIASLKPQKLFKGIEVTFAPGPDWGGSLMGDADQLRQVLVNLMLNAAQATGDAGTLAVEVRRQEAWAVIEICDSGPGVPLELRERIFEPFFSTKAKGEGTGLGLSVCRRLVEEHGGKLSVGDAPGGGARFRLELPLAGEEKCFDKGPINSLG
ncbi:hypothetical protein DESUT3_27900 [Desulfuromonas versatilis]|uniref:histidine kinase n=1 Tax=Desulfuromonas versatilis TaxID=2802975 RepID=A0ABN6E0B1_9BACT|nr:HAMP domain-containing sensor histidine kinase [Desulfuromonas versatilis]BCR05721.1 hypothetical protein DESUT3_27900 [Desulfuromonas versatilis]